MPNAADNATECRAAAGGNSAALLHLLGCDLPALRQWVEQHGHQRYRADQIAEWLFARGADTFAAMTNLSKALRAWLDEHAIIYRSHVARESQAGDGTRKLLLSWPDDTSVETVWIPDGRRNTACVSSQVGCPVGCRFCASGLGGFQRNLTAGEIVEQALRVRRLIESGEPGSTAGRLTNVVMMGMGEPLANYAAVIAAIRIINAPWGLGIGARKITLSTVGLPKQIRRLAQEDLQINLALSLHASNDELRRTLIPWDKTPIAELLGACAEYFAGTGREVTLEYVLLAGVNDQPQHARELGHLARRLRCNVNLLRYNVVPGLPYDRPSSDAAFDFQRRLRAEGINAHVRSSRGRDIDAACGQLRRAAEHQ
ncbi:MAG: 23S rRNA (adenine(2503)-C(2))-methyltransferase RlmN [Planctomycetes bacterium]|nr:23S rRNA (adenine(2503)-C(2))-methyltransferase RlmN [Planctomycetota bacterium]